MAKTRIEKIESIKTEIAQLENMQKKLIQQQREQERKGRTRRLCKRAGLLESLLPDTITLTDEHFKTFLEKVLLTDFTRKTLANITVRSITPPGNISAETEQDEDAGERSDGGNDEVVTA